MPNPLIQPTTDRNLNATPRLSVRFTDERDTTQTCALAASHVLHRSGDAFFLIADHRTLDMIYAGRDFTDEDLYTIEDLPALYAANPNVIVAVNAEATRLRARNYRDVVPRRVRDVSFTTST